MVEQCSYCHLELAEDTIHPENGAIWSCESDGCEKLFCSKCFADRVSQEVLDNQIEGDLPLYCPDCYLAENLVEE